MSLGLGTLCCEPYRHRLLAYYLIIAAGVRNSMIVNCCSILARNALIWQVVDREKIS